MNTELEKKINYALNEIEPHMLWLRPQSGVQFTEYYISSISITNVHAVNGTEVADITAGVRKCPSPVKCTSPSNPTDCYHRFFQTQMQESELTLKEKAICTRLFRENILKNYTHPRVKNVIIDLTKIIDILFEDILEASKREDRVSIYSVSSDLLRKINEKGGNTGAIKIIDLWPALLLDPNNYDKIQKHEGNNSFEQDKPCIIVTQREIVYE